MPDCQYREKPGAAPVCRVLVAPGTEYCPRHGMMEQARQAQLQQREMVALLKRQAKGIRPLHRRAMLEQGYQFTGNSICACGHPIEWWRNPNQHNAPYEPMPEIDSRATSHFAYCKRAFEKPWRKAS